MQPAKVATVSKPEDSFVEFKGYVNVHSVRRLIGAAQHFFLIGEPHELAIKAEMNLEKAGIEQQEKIFAVPGDVLDTAAFDVSG